MQIEVTVLPCGQSVDVIKGGAVPLQAGAVLIHGSGTSERVSLRALAVALAHHGIVAIVPDWHPNNASDSLTPVFDFADDVFEQSGIAFAQRTVVGYSAGGRAALGLVVNQTPTFPRCVAIATSSFALPKAQARARIRQGVQVLLVHGDADTVRPATESQSLGEQLAAEGVDTQVVVVAGGTHSSVVCATYEPDLQLSNPAAKLNAAMDEAVEAVARFIVK